jgi:hypothetical protein
MKADVKFFLQYEAIFNNDIEYSRDLSTYLVWFQGNEKSLQRFFQVDVHKHLTSGYDKDQSNYFWAQVSTKSLSTGIINGVIRKLHTKTPTRLVNKMVDVIMRSGYTYEILDDDVTQEDGTVIHKNRDRLNLILEANDFESFLKKAFTSDSVTGEDNTKIIINEELSEFPLIEVFPTDKVELKKKHGILIEHTFKTFFVKDKPKHDWVMPNVIEQVQFVLKEIHTFRKGVANVEYKLFKSGTNNLLLGDMIEVPLGSFADTAVLEDYSNSGLTFGDSFHKINKVVNASFRHSNRGESDMAGSSGLYDAIDEIYSTIIQEMRDGKLHKLIPESRLVKKNGAYIDVSAFTNATVINPDLAPDAESKIQFEKAEVNFKQNLDTYVSFMQTAANNFGLSIKSLGWGFESAVASEDSQQERERATRDTRTNKIDLIEPWMSKIFVSLLQMQDIMDKKSPQEYKIKVSFNNYIEDSMNTKVELATKGIEGQVLTIRGSQDVLYGDSKLESEKDILAVKIKLENNIPLTNQEIDLAVTNELASKEELEKPPPKEPGDEDKDETTDDNSVGKED